MRGSGRRVVPRPPNRAWLAAATFVLLAFLTYARALGADWLWDDDANVTACRPVLAWSGLRTIWLDPHAIQQYYPILHTAFWIEHKLWGLAPLGYHVVQVLLHALNAILFLRLSSRLGLPDRAAWIAALLFVVHPVHVESVAWITEMKNTLSLAFALGAAHRWVRWAGLDETSAGTSGRSRDLAIASLLFALALLSKSVTMSLPIALAIVTWWKRGRWERRTWSLAPWLAASAAFALLTIHLESENVGTARLDLGLGPLQRLLMAGRALWFYASTLAWPAHLSFVYPRWSLDPGSWRAWLFPLAAAAALLALLLSRARLGRGPLAAATIWLAMLAPMLGFVDVFWFRYADVSDHFQYHASLVPLAIAGLGMSSLGAFLERRWKRAGAVLACAVIVWLGAMAAMRVDVFHDSNRLWTETLRRNPDAWIAWNNLGRLTLDAGRTEEAETMLRRALAIDDRQHEPWNNLGICLMSAGRADEAVAVFERAIALHPTSISQRENLGRALVLRGDWSSAASVLEVVVRHPDHGADADVDLVESLARLERWDAALAIGRDARARHPDDVRLHLLEVAILRRRGDLKGALDVLVDAVARTGRRDPVVLDALATTLAGAGRVDEAVRILDEARKLRLGPDADEVLRRHLEQIRRGELPR